MRCFLREQTINWIRKRRDLQKYQTVTLEYLSGDVTQPLTDDILSSPTGLIVVLAEEEDQKITAAEKSVQAKPAEESQYSVKIFGFPVKELVSFGFGFSGKRQPEKEELQAR
ncbi:hypothetical protein U1Q18_029962 [Sarracenia purpurea var. burkii]